MKIYVDIDDVLARTIESLVDLLDRTHARRVEIEEVLHFDLSRSFGLSEHEIEAFMAHAHSDEVIESLSPIDGGIGTLEDWRSDGHAIHLVTGRPPSTNAASRRWLDRHGVAHTSLDHLDKWGRSTWNEGRLPAIRFEDLGEMALDFAVEDNLDTAVRLVEEFDVAVALMDQPWNRDLGSVAPATRERLTRCTGWDDVDRVAQRVR